MACAYIGLGTNLGDRTANLARARREMERRGALKILKASSIKETDPVDYLHQPKFMNQVVMVHTGLAPRELLRELKAIESLMGRSGGIPKGPRVIDLDILLYDNVVMDTPDLIIPHPGIGVRDFVREHLLELDVSLTDPKSGRAMALLGGE